MLKPQRIKLHCGYMGTILFVNRCPCCMFRSRQCCVSTRRCCVQEGA